MTQKLLKKPLFEHFLGSEWYPLLKHILESKVFHEIGTKLMLERGTGRKILPEHNEIHLAFRAFRECSPDDLKVVILGQDPYPQPGVFDGLAFSNGNLKHGQTISPSLRNVLAEVNRDIYGNSLTSQDPDLTRWANQGVLLLNTALTVVENTPGEHVALWKPFTKLLIEYLTLSDTGLIFMLWGNYAQQFKDLMLQQHNHHIIMAGHPSPLNSTRPFVGSGVFSKANVLIEGMNGIEYNIIW